MDTWTAVRRALFVEKISQREACRRFQLNFRTIQKIVRTLSPGHYERLCTEHQYPYSYRSVCKTLEKLRATKKAYERTSVIVTTNLPFQQWPEILGNARLTGAVLDCLTHRCNILEASGESYRLRAAKKRIKTQEKE